MKLSNKQYDYLKGALVFLIPAISFAIQQLGTIYGVDTENIIKTITVFTSLGGAVLLYVSGKYKEYSSLEDDEKKLENDGTLENDEKSE